MANFEIYVKSLDGGTVVEVTKSLNEAKEKAKVLSKTMGEVVQAWSSRDEEGTGDCLYTFPASEELAL